MIIQSETDLIESAYNAVRDGNGPLVRQYLVQRRSLDFDTEKTTGLVDTRYFDVIADDDYIYMAYIDGTNLNLKRYDLLTQLWDLPVAVATGVVNVSPSFGVDEVLYYVNMDGDVYRAETSDQWATSSTQIWVDISAESITEVYEIGGIDADAVILAEWRSDDNTRFHYLVTSGVLLSSDIYWPHRITGLDAIRVALTGTTDDVDLFVFSSVLPYQFGLRARGSEVQVEALERSGLIGFRVHCFGNTANWSDHIIIDEFDDSGPYQVRNAPRLTMIENDLGDDLVACVAYGIDGNENYNFGAHRVYFSGDGNYWSLEQLYPFAGHDNGMALIRHEDYAYLVGRAGLFRSLSTELTGAIAPDVQIDVTDRVISHDISHAGLRSSTLVLKNNDAWMDGTILGNNGLFSLITKLGVYTTTGAATGPQFVTVSHEIIDVIEPAEEGVSENLRLVSRDFGSLLNDRTQSPHVRESETQVIGADNFWDNTGTGYGGLRHTAGIEGSWSTANNILKLRSNNKTGIALSTFDTSMWNGSIQAKVSWASDSNDENVGLFFREFDKDNIYRVLYLADQDRIVVWEDRGGATIWGGTGHALNALGWSLGGDYWIKIVFRYGLLKVYTSTDGATWDFEYELVLPGQDYTATYYVDVLSIPVEKGGVGFTGKGYSAEDTWDEWDWDWDVDDGGWIYPEPEDPVVRGDGIGSAIVGLHVYVDALASAHGMIAYTNDLTSSTGWATLQSGLPAYNTIGVQPFCYINLDVHNADRAVLFQYDGGVYENTAWKGGGGWSPVCTAAQMLSAIQAVFPAVTGISVRDASFSIPQKNTYYLVVQEWNGGLTRLDAEETDLIIVRVVNKTISVCPYRFGFETLTSNHPRIFPSISASTTDVDTFYVTGRVNSGDSGKRYAMWWVQTWDDWDHISGSTIYETGKLDDATSGTDHYIFPAFYRENGVRNDPETEIYWAAPAGKIHQSLDGGGSFSPWTNTGIRPFIALTSTLNGSRHDTIEVGPSSSQEEKAFFINEFDGSVRGLYVLPISGSAIVDGDWTKALFPDDMTRVGWVGGWPYSASQFYIGTGQPGNFSLPDKWVLAMTQDSGVSWTNLTGNLQYLLPYIGGGGGSGARSHRVVRMTPHFAEA